MVKEEEVFQKRGKLLMGVTFLFNLPFHEQTHYTSFK